MKNTTKRSLVNYLIHRKYQSFYVRLFVVLYSVNLMGVLWLALSFEAGSRMGESTVFSPLGALFSAVRQHPSLLWIWLAFAACNLVLVYALALIATHRTFGPLIPIQRHIQKLIDGEYSSRISLRRNDHFAELANQLNELAQDLETRSGSSDASAAKRMTS